MKLTRDQPDGPLEEYRKRASFDWKSMKIKLYGEARLDYQNKFSQLMIKHSDIFDRPVKSLTLDETRRRCFAQMRLIADNDLVPFNSSMFMCGIIPFDGSLPIVVGVPFVLVPGTVMTLGSERHIPFLEKTMSGEYRGCFALTEVSHGSNMKGMRTTATYDPKSQSYVLNSPNFEAAKCWAACLGKSATHALVFALLITPDKVNHGLNCFIVQVRDPKTMFPMKGVTVGDLGEKVGLNGIDNGFVMFNNYRIPRENLLNKIGDVTVDGKYVPVVKNSSKRIGVSLGGLSMGRVSITNISATYLAASVTIALRYCSVRKQFGPENSEEIPVIEYQSVNARLMPLVAMTFALNLFSLKFIDTSDEFRAKIFEVNNTNDAAMEGTEIHVLSCATKPLCSWLAQNAIQECREACGGHGYLKVSRLGELRENHDANCTYEGENNVLLQQSSNWLLSQYPKFVNGEAIESPLKSADFLSNGKRILQRKFTAKSLDEAINPKNLVEAFEWLVCYYLQNSHERYEKLRADSGDDWSTKNDSQMFFARTLALVYGECAVFKNFLLELQNPKWKLEEREVLNKLCSLFGAWLLERRLGDLYAGGYASKESNMNNFLRQGIIELSKELVNEAMALVDVFAPLDNILQSALGMSDGKVYEHVEASIRANEESLERPSWWKEMLPSKL